MVDYRTAESIGERIQLARKARGFRSARALADEIGSPNITESILQNIETGRYANISMSQLLNIAFALRVSPSMLLAPIGRPADPVDLANLSPRLAALSVVEFDGWLTGSNQSAYRPTSADEMAERTELAALRDLEQLLRERERLRTVRELEDQSDVNSTDPRDWDKYASRIAASDTAIAEAAAYLASAGWNVQDWIDSYG